MDRTPYTIMFGPDKCGEDYKLHFIFRHKNPKTGEYEEKHAKKPDADLRTYYTDKKAHLYTLGETTHSHAADPSVSDPSDPSVLFPSVEP